MDLDSYLNMICFPGRMEDQRSGWLRKEKALDEKMWEPYSSVCRTNTYGIS